MSDLDRVLMAIRGLTLPDYRPLAETLPADPWIERDVLMPILSQDDDGLPLHRQVWVELARGHFKTGALAAVAIGEALRSHGTHVYAIASDLEQAQLLMEAIEGQCFRNPKLTSQLKPGKLEFVVKANGSRIKVMSSDAASFYGVGVNTRRLRIICDELTQWRDRRLFDAALTTLPKVRDAQLVVITNAGILGSWQEEARKSAAATGYLFAAEGVIASWLRPEDLAHVRANVPASVYRRYYENEWTLDAGDFITQVQLARCIDQGREPVERGDVESHYVAGVDLGLTHDRTVRAVVHYDADTDCVVLDAMRVWQGSRDNPVLIEEVERDVEMVDRAFGRPTFYCDPWQLKGTVERLRSHVDVREFNFTAQSVGRLSETLYSLIAAGRLRLYADPELERELLQLQVKQSAVGWRIDHQRGGFSDRAIALGVAVLHAVEMGRGGSIFFLGGDDAICCGKPERESCCTFTAADSTPLGAPSPAEVSAAQRAVDVAGDALREFDGDTSGFSSLPSQRRRQLELDLRTARAELRELEQRVKGAA